MYKRIVVPLDGSAVALQVMPYATALAKATDAKLELLEAVTVYPTAMTLPEATPPIEDLEEYQKDRRKEAKARLDGIAKTERKRGLKVDVLVAEAHPAEAVIAAGEREPDSLIAISTHGRSGIGRWVLGSVTDKVVRHATVPTLVVRARNDTVTSTTPKVKLVILPLDGSTKSETAIPHAIGMAKAMKTGISLVRAISPMAYGDAFADYVPTMYDDLTAEAEKDVREYLAFQAKCIREQGVTDVSVHTPDGYAATAILDEAGDTGENVVVMATHGRSGVGRWVLGSVADRVVRHSAGPVLVVRPPKEA